MSDRVQALINGIAGILNEEPPDGACTKEVDGCPDVETCKECAVLQILSFLASQGLGWAEPFRLPDELLGYSKPGTGGGMLSANKLSKLGAVKFVPLEINK